MQNAYLPLVCINLPDYTAQIVCRQKGWDHNHPVVLVPHERPSARILSANAAAQELGVYVGMSYSQALHVSPLVRAGVIRLSDRKIADAAVHALLHTLSPTVEVSQRYDGVAWLEARGISRLFGGFGPWLRRVGSSFHDEGWRIRVVRGWSRAGTLVSALQQYGPRVFHSLAAEQAWLNVQSLLPLLSDSDDREHLELLDLTRIGRFIGVSEHAVASRFSQSTLDVYRMLLPRRQESPLEHQPSRSVLSARQILEPPLSHAIPIVRVLEDMLGMLRSKAEDQGVWIERLDIFLHFERVEPQHERIQCGHATRDIDYIRRLLHMRFADLRMVGRFVNAIHVEAIPVVGQLRQQELRFDPRASSGPSVAASMSPEQADRSVAVLQAELGVDTVVGARVIPGRFPEQRFSLAPLRFGSSLLDKRVQAEHQDPSAPMHRIRRIACVSVPPDGSRVPGAVRPSDRRIAGPFIVEGAWWTGPASIRSYEYRQAADGSIAWVYAGSDGMQQQGTVA